MKMLAGSYLYILKSSPHLAACAQVFRLVFGWFSGLNLPSANQSKAHCSSLPRLRPGDQVKASGHVVRSLSAGNLIIFSL